jgi:tRNA pseudouridine38-40 synthase
MRFLFEISYHGVRYHGWQTQANAKGVQQVVEEVFSKLLRQPVKIVGSGRTDTGVHCRQQFFHADLPCEPDREKFLVQLNSFLPPDIAIRGYRKVKPDASARYDATERTYEYRITREKDPLEAGRAFFCYKPLDILALNEAAQALLGDHDFEAFSKVKTDVNHFRCNIKKAHWREEGHLLIFTITANRFLRGMVRAIVGTLLDVGSGKTSPADFRKIVQSRDRKKAGMNVPPEGLYLHRVKYPAHIFLD